MFSKIEGDENLYLGSTTSDKIASENSTYLGCKKLKLTFRSALVF